jgi:malonate transporter MadM subunit
LKDVLQTVLAGNGLITAFALVGLVVALSYFLSAKLTANRIHGSAIAILAGLSAAWWAGSSTGGSRGVADIGLLSGIGLMGGGMLRDFAIVSTAFGVKVSELRRAGLAGTLSIFIGVVLSFVVGVVTAMLFGYRDAVSLTTIGAGAVTYIVGPVTGTALGADSAVMALSVATGVVKSVLVMATTPWIAGWVGLNNPASAMVFGGLMGTTSGVAGGLAATDPKLVPYGALTATFYTGVGCLLCPSLLYFAMRLLLTE